MDLKLLLFKEIKKWYKRHNNKQVLRIDCIQTKVTLWTLISWNTTKTEACIDITPPVLAVCGAGINAIFSIRSITPYLNGAGKNIIFIVYNKWSILYTSSYIKCDKLRNGLAERFYWILKQFLFSFFMRSFCLRLTVDL